MSSDWKHPAGGGPGPAITVSWHEHNKFFYLFIAKVKLLVLRRRKNIWRIPAVLLLAYSNCGAQFIVSRCWKKGNATMTLFHNTAFPVHTCRVIWLPIIPINSSRFCSDTRKNKSSSSTETSCYLCYCALQTHSDPALPQHHQQQNKNIHSLTSFSYFTLNWRLLSPWNKLRPNQASWSTCFINIRT